MVEKVRSGNGLVVIVTRGVGVEGLDFCVDGRGLPRYGFEHCVAAEGVEVGTGVGKGELFSDRGEGDGGVKGEPGERELARVAFGLICMQ